MRKSRWKTPVIEISKDNNTIKYYNAYCTPMSQPVNTDGSGNCCECTIAHTNLCQTTRCKACTPSTHTPCGQ